MKKEHYRYLKAASFSRTFPGRLGEWHVVGQDRAAAKDRVLKQQSIFLAEYLGDLNQNIEELKVARTSIAEKRA
eukprot:5105686-Amphidinium_carterae.2